MATNPAEAMMVAQAAQTPTNDLPNIMAQLSAMPPKQALTLVQLKQQQAQSPEEQAIWQAVAQQLMQTLSAPQPQQSQNPVAATLSAPFGG